VVPGDGDKVEPWIQPLAPERKLMYPRIEIEE